MATTWGFHYRLVRALTADGSGVLSRAVADAIRAVVLDPPPARLLVLDPRDVTASAASLANRHGLNLLAAELFAHAIRHDAEVHLTEANVGRRWPELMAAEGITLTVD